MKVFEGLLYDIGIHLSDGNTPWMNKMDGYLLSPCKNFPLVIIMAKNEIGSVDSGAEPFAESLVSYRTSMENWEQKTMKLSFLFPCLHITVFGKSISV